ncbi:PEP-CTERM motif protein [Poriferisphaera corsica]|uniref:PEP-CTERM motif protein n=1 Tax=Poriferisphaera corsica TaxID=2528020 RepID=A0A517YRB4_9BACT|nr:PEP-CTERM sorting domain-containing protein [Poriferisphaera corsica]QDU32773.1 PEP-CTERM motif protein [Poriferisphaera corsica]
MRQLACVAGVCACALGFGLIGEVNAERYRAVLMTDFLSDKNDSDGFDFMSITGGEIIFNVQDVLTFEDNIENQGGSLTIYTGAIFESFTLFSSNGNVEVVSQLTHSAEAEVTLWDRNKTDLVFDNQHHLDVDMIQYDGMDIELEVQTDEGDPNHENLFTAGTPGPNVPNAILLPLFSNVTERDALTNDSTVSFYSDGTTYAEGSAYFLMSSLELVEVPEPASLMLLGLGSLAIFGRKRLI